MFRFTLLWLLPVLSFAVPPRLPGIHEAMQRHVDAGVISGAVTMVVTGSEILHLEATGFADTQAPRAMRPDTLFALRSMTKPITGAAVMMMQDEGKLQVDDPVARYIPAFADLRTPAGQPANITISHLLTHTSGLGDHRKPVRELEQIVQEVVTQPLRFEPGARWQYNQAGMNTAARIVELVSGQRYDRFLVSRIFEPLGIHDTTHYPSIDQQRRLVTPYRRNPQTGKADPQAWPDDLASTQRAPLANTGLFAPAADYARFCQMLLNDGELEGFRLLTPESVASLSAPRTNLPEAGFVPGSQWGLSVGVVTEPQEVTAMLSAGTYGHGGAYGTQAWIDPSTGRAYLLMIQRSNYGNADGSDIRRDFQQAAVDALEPR